MVGMGDGGWGMGIGCDRDVWDFRRDRGWDGNIDGRNGDRDVGDLESDIIHMLETVNVIEM